MKEAMFFVKAATRKWQQQWEQQAMEVEKELKKHTVQAP